MIETIPTPSDRAVAHSQMFLSALEDAGLKPTNVADSVVGGIGVTVRKGNRKGYVEFYNDGKICALLSDGVEPALVFPVMADAFNALVAKIKQFIAS